MTTNSCCATKRNTPLAHDNSIFVDDKNTTLDKVLRGMETGTAEEIQNLNNNVEVLNVEIINIDDRVTNLEHTTIEVDSELSDTSIHPVQNKVITNALEDKVDDDDYLNYWDVNKIVFNIFGF